MNDPERLRRFKQWRKEHPYEFTLSFQFREKVPLPFEWVPERRGDKKVAKWADDTFRYVAKIVPENDYRGDELEFYGTWCKPGAFPDVIKRRVHVDSRSWTHWKPAYSILERQNDNHDNHGMSWAVAYEKAVESTYKDLDRVEDFGVGWCHVGVIVEAYLLADEEYEDALGEASCWAYESDMDDVEFCSVAQDLAAEAASEAKKHAERICRRLGKQGHFTFAEAP